MTATSNTSSRSSISERFRRKAAAKPTRRVLLVDNDEIVCGVLEHSLQFLDYACDTARDLKTAMLFLQKTDYELIICDLNLPDGKGTELIDREGARNKQTPLILISDQYNLERLWRAHTRNTVDFLIKPITLANLKNGIDHALRMHKIFNAPTLPVKTAVPLNALTDYWSAAFEKIPQFVMLINEQFQILRINQRYAEFLGTTTGALIGRVCHETIGDSKKPCEDCPYQRSQHRHEENRSSSGNYNVKRDGEYFNATVVPLTAGAERGALVMLRNVTEENMLIAHMSRLINAMNRSNEAMLILSGDGDVLFANDAFLQIFGFKAEEIQFEALAALFTDEMLYAEFKFALADGSNYAHDQLPLRRRDGEILPMRFLANKILDGNGEIIVVHVYDVTSMLEQQKLKERTDRLQGVLEMAGSTCHFLNQPLQAIYLYASMLQKNLATTNAAGNEKLLGYVLKIESEAAKMNERLQKFSQINQYETLNYIDHGMIVDVDNAIKPTGEGENNV